MGAHLHLLFTLMWLFSDCNSVLSDLCGGCELETGGDIANTVSFTLLAIKYVNNLGTPSPSKIDEFSEKFQTAFDPPPPPHFRKVILQIF